MKAQDCDVYWPTRVSRKMKFELKPRFFSLALGGDIASVVRSRFFDGFERSCHLFRINEIHDCRFRIPPREVGKQLVDGLMILLLPAPKLALRNKHVLSFVSHQDVGLTVLIEGLSGCADLKSRLKIENQMVAQCLLVLICIRTWEALENAARVEDCLQNLAVDSLVEGRFRRVLLRWRSWFWGDLLPGNYGHGERFWYIS